MPGEVRFRVHACPNDCLRYTKCEVHDSVCKHVIRCTKKRVPRFLILEALRLSPEKFEKGSLSHCPVKYILKQKNIHNFFDKSIYLRLAFMVRPR